MWNILNDVHVSSLLANQSESHAQHPYVQRSVARELPTTKKGLKSEIQFPFNRVFEYQIMMGRLAIPQSSAFN